MENNIKTWTTKPADDYELQLPEWDLNNIKLAAIQHRILRPRSLAWAILLNAVPHSIREISKSLETHRNFYNDLREKLSMDPRSAVNDDPLSQNDESAWNQHFCDNELKALILQDVIRTYPDEVYFRDQDVQNMMVQILFFWARTHGNVGYRQGMHEVLAPLLFELYVDRKYATNQLSDTLKQFLNVEYLEHYSYMLFNAVMKGLEKFYTTGDVVPSSCGRLPTSTAVHNPNEVVRYLEKVREEYLVPLDSELATHLANCNITMQLFGIRWLKLLFGREFPRTEIPHLWGFLFADGPMLPNIHYIMVAMLISIRSTLLSSDAESALSAVMRPALPSVGHVCALALHLRRPQVYPRPPEAHVHRQTSPQERQSKPWEQAGTTIESNALHGEGVAEGADIARELAALALVRAHLPPVAIALHRAIPRPQPPLDVHLRTLLQLSALLQCRNHAIVDVETALEASEGLSLEGGGRRQLVPVAIATERRSPPSVPEIPKKVNGVKEVPLKLFNQTECDNTSDLPCLDPLGLRTD